MSLDPEYAAPFSWWGPGWDTPAPRGIDQLLADGTIDLWTAANLWAALARRYSLVVVGGPSRIGKTTLLTALLEFLPPDTRRLYPRGCFETFAFLTDPAIVATETALLINEISPHLPVYLWGPAVGRMLEAADRGFTLLATAHADSVAEFVAALTGSPLRLPAARIAAFEFVAVMERSVGNRSGRRVRGVWRLRGTTSGVELEMLAPPSRNISQEDSNPSSHLPAWFPPDELTQRQAILSDPLTRRIAGLPALPWSDDGDVRRRAP